VSQNARVIEKNYALSKANDFSDNLLASENPEKHDMVIANPPCFKLPKDAPEALAMKAVCRGAPNMCFLFAATGLLNSRDDGEMVRAMPRSWTSGAYFSRFRDYFLSFGKLTDIRLFDGRDRVFDKESVLRETMIVKSKKTGTAPETIRVTSSADSRDLGKNPPLNVPCEVVVAGKEKFARLVRTEADAKVSRSVDRAGKPLPDIDLKMKTGLVVDLGNRESSGNSPGDNVVPLFRERPSKTGGSFFPRGQSANTRPPKSRARFSRTAIICSRNVSRPKRSAAGCAAAFTSPGRSRVATRSERATR
jgi:adenine-specific DNA-methyltransferase